MPTPTIQDTAQALAKLSAGERAWFSWCAQAEPPLLIRPLASDPLQAALQADRAAAFPNDAHTVDGIALRDDLGQVTFLGKALPSDLLEQLARWVVPAAATHKGLAVLSQAQMTTVEPDGARTTPADPALWKGLPRPVAPGSPTASLAALERAPTGARAAVWATDGGAQGTPTLVARPMTKDPSAMNAAVHDAIRAGGTRGTVITGVAHHREDGSWVLFTEDDTADALGVLATVAAQPGMGGIASWAVAQVADEALAGGTGAVEALDPTAQTLGSLTHGDQAFFILAELSDGGVFFRAAKDKVGLDPSDAPGDVERMVRGRVVATDQGWLDLRIRAPFPGLIPLLAGWAIPRAERHEGLRALGGARVTVRERDDRITDRSRDDRAWASMPTTRED